MTNLIRKVTFLAVSAFLLSCGKKDKKDDVSPLIVGNEQADKSVERYWPLAVGNKWSYKTSSFSYDITVTGKKVIGNAEYYDCYNSYSKQSGYIRYEGGKYYNVGTPANSATSVELFLLDEKAQTGAKWKMGEISTTSSGITVTSLYNCEVVGRPATFKVEEKTYNDVYAVKMTTSIKYKLGAEFTKYLSAEEIAEYEEMYEEMGSVASQITYYAKGVGMIGQTSNDLEGLNLSLVSYSLVK